MDGFIHIYARGDTSKKDQVIIRFDKVNSEAYDAKLKPLHINTLHKNIYEKNEHGELKNQGNLGVLSVSPAYNFDASLARAFSTASADFLGQFSGHVVEFTLSDNVQIVPTYGLHYQARELPTLIKFQQYDHGHKCYHEVLLVTKEGALNFEVSYVEPANRMRINQWDSRFKQHNFDVDVEETYIELDRQLLLEDIFHGVSEEDLVSTSIGYAFDPTFRIAPIEAHVNQQVPEVAKEVEVKIVEAEEEIKVGQLMMLEPESDSSDDEVCHEYDPVTGGIRKYYDECKLEMELPPPPYNTLIDSASVGIIQTPDLLKQDQ